MNPYTLLLLVDSISEEPMHIIDIQFLTRLSSTTIYRARLLGYLERTAPGYFWATDKLLEEVKQYSSIRALRVA